MKDWRVVEGRIEIEELRVRNSKIKECRVVESSSEKSLRRESELQNMENERKADYTLEIVCRTQCGEFQCKRVGTLNMYPNNC